MKVFNIEMIHILLGLAVHFDILLTSSASKIHFPISDPLSNYNGYLQSPHANEDKKLSKSDSIQSLEGSGFEDEDLIQIEVKGPLFVEEDEPVQEMSLGQPVETTGPGNQGSYRQGQYGLHREVDHPNQDHVNPPKIHLQGFSQGQTLEDEDSFEIEVKGPLFVEDKDEPDKKISLASAQPIEVFPEPGSKKQHQYGRLHPNQDPLHPQQFYPQSVPLPSQQQGYPQQTYPYQAYSKQAYPQQTYQHQLYPQQTNPQQTYHYQKYPHLTNSQRLPQFQQQGYPQPQAHPQQSYHQPPSSQSDYSHEQIQPHQGFPWQSYPATSGPSIQYPNSGIYQG